MSMDYPSRPNGGITNLIVELKLLHIDPQEFRFHLKLPSLFARSDLKNDITESKDKKRSHVNKDGVTATKTTHRIIKTSKTASTLQPFW